MKIKDAMTTSPICCRPDDSVRRVAELMREHGFGVIPVCAGKELVGIITDRDIAIRAVADGNIDEPVREAMTQPVHTVRQNEDVQVAIDTMEKRQVRRLPVLDNDGKVVGIIAPSDLAPVFASTNVADFLLAVSYWTPRAIA